MVFSTDEIFGTFSIDPALTPAQKVQSCLDILLAVRSQAHEKPIQRALQVVDAKDDGTVEWEITVTENMCSDRKILHGAATTLIFDTCSVGTILIRAIPGSWCLISKSDPMRAHVAHLSRNLNVTFLRPTVIGDTLRVTTSFVNIGSRQGLVKCEAVQKATGKLIAYGLHEVTNAVQTWSDRKPSEDPKTVRKEKL